MTERNTSTKRQRDRRACSRRGTGLLASMLMACCAPAWAGDGDLDPAFGSGGYATTGLPLLDLNLSQDLADKALLDSQGRLLLLGSSHRLLGVQLPLLGDLIASFQFSISRLTPAGVVDAGYAMLGRASHTYARPFVPRDAVLDGSDRPHVAFADRVLRFSANGAADNTYGVSGSADLGVAGFDIRALARSTDGSLFVAGTRTLQAGVDAVVVKLNANGTRVAGFGSGGIATVRLSSARATIRGLAIDGSGRPVLAGSVEVAAPGRRNMLALRLTSAGATDATFGGGEVRIGFDRCGGSAPRFTDNFDEALAVRADADGSVLLLGNAGAESCRNLIDPQVALVRLNANGTLDPGFSEDGRTLVAFSSSRGASEAASMVPGPGSSIVIAGTFRPLGGGTAAMAVTRLTQAGVMDTGFGDELATPGGVRLLGFILPGADIATTLLADGDRVIVAGAASNLLDLEFGAARLANASAPQGPPPAPDALFRDGFED